MMGTLPELKRFVPLQFVAAQNGKAAPNKLVYQSIQKKCVLTWHGLSVSE